MSFQATSGGLLVTLGVVALCAFILLGLVVVVVSHRLALARGRLVSDLPERATVLRSFLGGARWPTPGGLGNATAPLARLTVYDWGLELAGSVRLLRLIVPTWQLRFDEVARVSVVELHLMPRGPYHGLRIEADLLEGPLVFWTGNPAGVGSYLKSRGFNVELAVEKLALRTNEPPAE